MSKPLILQEWIDRSIRERMQAEERLLALAVALGAKSIIIEWPRDLGYKTKHLLDGTRKLRRRALKLAIAHLENTVPQEDA